MRSNRGRPKKDEYNRRTKSVHIRLTEEEYLYIQACADDQNKSMSDFIRDLTNEEVDLIMQSWDE